jgi:cellulose synthase/poly-beta-1,6-N-acetylglucosamine synthase-like glycosyltransferase
MTIFYDILGWIVVIYAIAYTSSKIFFAVVSIIQIKLYTKLYPHVATEEELERYAKSNEHELPTITIIMPAFNEEPNIIDSVTSCLRQTYKLTEVIVACDGGTDGTLEKLVDFFHLYEVEDDFKHSANISHQPVNRYLKSATYGNLIVIDKENGGKADAQNSGVAIATGEILALIDADSILESNSLIHLASIFERDPETIGIGTPIGVVNDSIVGEDGVVGSSFPKSFWAKIQVLEYLRSFLLGRMAMQKFKGLMIVSGAFGVYQKWIIEAVGGYEKGSMAEDMDIDCKIWRFINDNKLRFKLKYIPEVFCWSQVPDDFQNLLTQRDRWARGLSQTIWKNRIIFFNRRYGSLGYFSYPYYVFFEWMTPFLEITGIFILPLATYHGVIDPYLILHVFVAYYVVGLALNVVTIVVEASTGGHYKNSLVLRKLVVISLIEPFFYHWVNSFMYVYGNVKMVLLRRKGWGRMDRKVFDHGQAEEISKNQAA